MKVYAPVVVVVTIATMVLAGFLVPASADAKRFRAFVYPDRTNPAKSVVVDDFRVNETVYDDGGVQYLWVRGPEGSFQLNFADIGQIEFVKFLGFMRGDWTNYEVKVTGHDPSVVITGTVELRVMRGVAGGAAWYLYPATQKDRGTQLWRLVFGDERAESTIPSGEMPKAEPAPAAAIAMQPAAPAPPSTSSDDELFARLSLADLNSQKPLGDVFFEFDRSELGRNGEETLQRNAEWLKRWPTIRARIDGHADPRGTNEYNKDLGMRRAERVREFLTALGISASRLETVTFGDEHPVCTEPTEECWARNRRAHFVLTAK
ncbi:MAG: OmpA family protein [Acidobacteriota bacterium]